MEDKTVTAIQRPGVKRYRVREQVKCGAHEMEQTWCLAVTKHTSRALLEEMRGCIESTSV